MDDSALDWMGLRLIAVSPQQMARSKTISPNVGRLSRSQVFAKRGLHKGQKKSEKPATPETPLTKEVNVGGEKNGSTRLIPTSKAPRYYPAEDVRKPKKNRKTFVPTKLRSSITPGTVLILLAGRFRGKRVVFLKQLESGLLLVTGPFRINGVPLRRVNQAYVIATSTRIDFEGITVRTNFLAYDLFQNLTPFFHLDRRKDQRCLLCQAFRQRPYLSRGRVLR
jgi:large subunit ribosomal protein L6e